MQFSHSSASSGGCSGGDLDLGTSEDHTTADLSSSQGHSLHGEMFHDGELLDGQHHKEASVATTTILYSDSNDTSLCDQCGKTFSSRLVCMFLFVQFIGS